MRGPARLALLAALLTAAAPFMPMVQNAAFISFLGDHEKWTCSLVAIARESFGELQTPAALRESGCGLRVVRTIATDDPGASGRLDGRIECAAFFLLAVLGACAAIPKWTRHAWVIAVAVVGVAAWTWWALRSDLLVILTRGGGHPGELPAWMRPWPFVLAALAALALSLASMWTRVETQRRGAAGRRMKMPRG